MFRWITTHKTELGFALSAAVLAASTGCAILGINAGDFVSGEVTTAQSGPLGFDAAGMSVSEVYDALDASYAAEMLHRTTYDASFERVLATVAPRKQLADDLDAGFAELGRTLADAANQQLGAVSIAGVGVTSLTTPLLGLMTLRKREDRAYDMGAADKERDLRRGAALANDLTTKGAAQAGTDAA